MNDDNLNNKQDEQLLPEGHAIDSELPEHATPASNEVYPTQVIHPDTPDISPEPSAYSEPEPATIMPSGSASQSEIASMVQPDLQPEAVINEPTPPTVAPLTTDNTPAAVGGTYPIPIQTPATSQPPKKSRKKLVIVGIVVAALFLIGGASAGAMYYVFPKIAQSKIDNGMANLVSSSDSATIKGNYSAELTVSGSEIPGDKVSATLSTQIEADGKSYSRLTADFMSWKPQIDVMTLDNQLYLKIDGLAEARKLGETYSKSKNQDETDAAQILGISSIYSKYDKQWLSLDMKELNSAAGSNNSEEFLSQDARKQVADIYKKNAFIDYKKRFKGEKINGKKTQHIQVVINEQKLKVFTNALKAANIKNLDLTDDDIRSLDEFVRKYDLANYPIDVWLGPKNSLVQIAYKHGYKSASISFKLTEQNAGTYKIEKPAKSQPLNKLLEDSLGGFSGVGDLEELDGATSSDVPEYLDASKSARDTERKADIRAIQSKVAEYYAINGGYPLSISNIGLAAGSCRAPSTTDTCAKPSYTYKPLNANNTVCKTTLCAEYEITYSGMETVSNPFKVSSRD